MKLSINFANYHPNTHTSFSQIQQTSQKEHSVQSPSYLLCSTIFMVTRGVYKYDNIHSSHQSEKSVHKIIILAIVLLLFLFLVLDIAMLELVSSPFKTLLRKTEDNVCSLQLHFDGSKKRKKGKGGQNNSHL